MITRLSALALALALGGGLLVGCGDDSDPEADRPSPSPSPTEQTTEASTDTPTEAVTDEPSESESRKPAKPGTRIVSRGSDFGPMLFDETGQAIYLFDVETTAEPGCYDACAEAWPPVLSKGKPVAGRGVDASLLGTTERTDGTTQVTYNDHPLYLYAHKAKDEVKCHDVFMNGGNWYVVQPGGDAAPPA
jgi:predicted lipoprotein with Yx(FWY)xxD motif